MQELLSTFRSLFQNAICPVVSRDRRPRGVVWLVLLCVICSTLPPKASAEDVAFDKTKYSSIKQPKEAPVILTITDSKILIKPKKKDKKNPAPDIEIPFSSIDSLSYEQSVRHRVSEGMGIMPLSIATGAVIMSTKTRSYWLDIEYHKGDTKELTVLRLDKSQQESVISTLQARTGKQIAALDANTSAFNPTAGSQNMDEVVPYPISQVAAALKPAMESMGCKVKKAKPDHLECKRFTAIDRERNGAGGEKVTAELEAKGEQTRVRISTGKGCAGRRMMKKNWSTPIYKEMIKNLEKASSQNVTAATSK